MSTGVVGAIDRSSRKSEMETYAENPRAVLFHSKVRERLNDYVKNVKHL